MSGILETIGAALEAVTQVNKYVLTPIKNQFNYLVCYKSNIQYLGAQVEELNQTRDNLQLEVDAAKRNAEAIGRDVEKWFKKVAEINAKKDRIIQEGTRVQQGCFYGRCPNIKLRYCLSREAKKGTEVAVELLKDAGNAVELLKDAPIPTASPGIEVDSRKSKEEEIVKALKDDKAYVVAVCGMGGVGKTTMVKKIEDRVREEKMFEELAMAVVSRTLDLCKVQQQIAERLGLKLEEQTNPARAERLHKRLKDAKSVLIILDDVWKKLNLQEIGIPSKSSHEGCKVILTSRVPRECRKIEDSVQIIQLDVLPEPEAWNLFKEKAGQIIEKPDLHPIAVNVAKECKGLPLALLTVAAALRNSSVPSWEDALHQLKRCMPTNIEEVYVPLKWSYDQLQSEEARYLFLLCCLFPEDYEIPLDTLVRYGFGLHIFADVENLVEARNRVHGLVEMLQDRCHVTFWNLPNTAFLPRVTQLHISVTHRLKAICCGQPHAGSFSNLTYIALENCSGLKNGFSFSVAAMLSNLERVDVQSCHSIETVFFEQEGQGESDATRKMAFPKLSQISHGRLPQLCAFCKPIDTITFEFPQLYRMRLYDCPMLKSFCAFPEGDQNSTQQFLFDQKVIMCNGLKKLELDMMDFRTEIFGPRIPIGNFFGLEALRLTECSGSVNLFSNSMCREIPNLKTLEVSDCPMLEQVIAKDVKEEDTNSEATLFPLLKQLTLVNLQTIKQFCHMNRGFELPSLEYLDIISCPLMEIFSQSSAASESNIGMQSFFDGV